MNLDPITPHWPGGTPPGVRALTTTRTGGVSAGPFASLNLALHVGDDPTHVHENRRRLRALLPAAPAWLSQVHGAAVVDARHADDAVRADASYTREIGVVCAVLTADCLPVLLAARDGGVVGIAHAGWRGLAAGVIEAAVRALETPPQELIAWFGPGISATSYSVGSEVRAAFVDQGRQRIDADSAAAFVERRDGRYSCDLYALARIRLRRLGVDAVGGGAYCTYGEAERFFSFRRDAQTGRMATLIWRE